MFQNFVMGGLMMAFLAWVLFSFAFGLLIWPRIARRMHEINGLDKDSE